MIHHNAKHSKMGLFERKAGDWDCTKCSFMNFASRRNCHKCNAAAPTSVALEPSGECKPGDWTCPNCSILNFASRRVCFKCNTNVPAERSRPRRLYDWRCPLCNEFNFGSRAICRKCAGPRPVEKDALPTSDSNKGSECVICMEAMADHCSKHCGHKVMCLTCALRLTKCPICRKPMNQGDLIRVYDS